MYKAIKIIACIFAGLILLKISASLVAKATQSPPLLEGYISDTYVKLPEEKYTFLAKVEMAEGRPVMQDNLWGYRYPSMEPLTYPKRGEFMTAYENTDWVKVTVLPRPDAKACYDNGIKSSFQSHSSIFLRGDDRFIQDNALYFNGLKRMSVPDKPEYDPKNYRGPAHTYWDDRSGHACTMINCERYMGIAGEYCHHHYIDTQTHLEYAMDYDSSLLPEWQDVQNKTVSIFTSFKK